MSRLSLPRRCLLGYLSGFVIFAMAGCGGGGSSSSSTSGNLEGYVYSQAAAQGSMVVQGTRSSSLTPIQGAAVVLQGTGYSTTTDTTGHFMFTGIPAGSYTAQFSKQGFTSISVSAAVVGGQTSQVSSMRKWAFLVYMNGDNDLEQFGIENMNEMEMVGSTSDVAMVVQFARTAGFDASNGDWTGTRRFYVTKDNDPNIIHSPVLEDMGQVDMGDWRELQKFVQWAMTNYPAQHYALDLWDHGAGFRSRAAQTTRGFSFSDTFNSFITVPQLPTALSGLPAPVDMIIWDASLMQMAEIGYEARHVTPLIVGSEESPPGRGYPYETFLGSLVANPSMTPDQLATQIVQQTISSLGGTFDVTQSAVHTSGFDNLRAATDNLAQVLTANEAQYASQLATVRNTAQKYGSGAPVYRDFKDLVDYCNLLKQDVNQSQVNSAADAVIQAVQSMVLSEAHSGASVANSHGLSIYVPDPTSIFPTYADLAYSKDGRWDEFIASQPQ